mmetsp:Transcript_42655/g.132741  ORF Transcript_42655/g.132741 Transcript_42655/m.132741 type:complete len:223 (-) Transcript_42655:93-761(-)
MPRSPQVAGLMVASCVRVVDNKNVRGFSCPPTFRSTTSKPLPSTSSGTGSVRNLCINVAWAKPGWRPLPTMPLECCSGLLAALSAPRMFRAQLQAFVVRIKRRLHLAIREQGVAELAMAVPAFSCGHIAQAGRHLRVRNRICHAARAEVCCRAPRVVETIVWVHGYGLGEMLHSLGPIAACHALLANLAELGRLVALCADRLQCGVQQSVLIIGLASSCLAA